MANDNLAPHELLHLHELFLGEATGIGKLQAGLQMVQDQQLKGLIQTSLQTKQQRMNKIQQLMQQFTEANVQ